MDNGFMIGVWVLAAMVLAVGELVTFGFFLLPFAFGAVAAAVVAATGAAVVWQLVAFAVVSLVTLWIVQRLTHGSQQAQRPAGVGSERYVDRVGVVLRTVHPIDGEVESTMGMVKVGTEEWIAAASDDKDIEAGARITVTEVRGTRLIVVAAADSAE